VDNLPTSEWAGTRLFGMIGDRRRSGGAFVSVRVDPGPFGSAGLLGDPFCRLRIAAAGPELVPAPDAVPQLASPFRARVGRVVIAASLWPDKLWFWLGTAALLAAVATPAIPPAISARDSSPLGTTQAMPEDRLGS
jgi:hypothetical protein